MFSFVRVCAVFEHCYSSFVIIYRSDRHVGSLPKLFRRPFCACEFFFFYATSFRVRHFVCRTIVLLRDRTLLTWPPGHSIVHEIFFVTPLRLAPRFSGRRILSEHGRLAFDGLGSGQRKPSYARTESAEGTRDTYGRTKLRFSSKKCQFILSKLCIFYHYVYSYIFLNFKGLKNSKYSAPASCAVLCA